MDINEIGQHQGVKDFLQKVINRLYTLEDAKAIEAELKDHILSLSEDYLAAGHSSETAIRKALLQMGDPTEIGYSFTDFEAMKRRKYLRVGLKWLSVAIVIVVFLGFFYITGGFEESSVEAVNQTSEEEGSLFSNYLLIFYFPFVMYNAFKSFGIYQMGISIHKIKISKEPLMILWPYKQKFQWEYMALGFFFLPFFILMIFADQGNNPMEIVLLFASVVFSIWLYLYSERFRIPKYMLLEEGIVVKNKLISWTSVDRISWTQDYLADRKHYVLTLEHLIKTGQQTKTLNGSVKTKVYVNANQYQQLNALLKELRA